MIRELQTKCGGTFLKSKIIREAVEWEAKEMTMLELSLEKNIDMVLSRRNAKMRSWRRKVVG